MAVSVYEISHIGDQIWPKIQIQDDGDRVKVEAGICSERYPYPEKLSNLTLKFVHLMHFEPSEDFSVPALSYYVR